MKKNLFLVILLFTSVFMSCEKDLSDSGEITGKLHIDIGSNISIQEIGGDFKTIPAMDDFIVNVFKADGSIAISFNRVAEMPDTLELAVGDYYVEVFSDNNMPAEFDNPYYYGETRVFTISSNRHLFVEVTCVLSNTVVSVLYSDNVKNSFLDYTTTVSSDLGYLLFDKSEERFGYFQTAPLDIAVDLAYLKPDGTIENRIMSGSIFFPLPNKHYQISVDASIVDGMASFYIIQDTTEVLVEVVELSDGPDTGETGLPGYGDLLITEIMCDPSALSDTEGEWIELFNNSNKEINLKNLIIGRDDTNMHTITDSIVLSPGEYYVLVKTEQATDAENKYVYGSAITLTNSGAILTIYNEEVDGNPGEVIFAVNYGESGFPGGSGASISLSPNQMNSADAILGSSWCNSTSTYNTGDFGTPGLANDNCQ